MIDLPYWFQQVLRTTTEKLTLVVPGHPVVKERPRVTRGHTFTPRTTVNGELAIRTIFRFRYPRQPLYTGDVGLVIVCWMEGYTQKDWDNLGKLVSDALNNTAYVDDSQIISAVVLKHVPDRLVPRADGKGMRKRRAGDVLTFQGQPYSPHVDVQVFPIDDEVRRVG